MKGREKAQREGANVQTRNGASQYTTIKQSDAKIVFCRKGPKCLVSREGRTGQVDLYILPTVTVSRGKELGSLWGSGTMYNEAFLLWAILFYDRLKRVAKRCITIATGAL